MKITAMALVFLFAVSCGDSGGGASGEHQHTGGGGHSETSTTAFGTAADASEADRSEEVSAVDPLKFEPTSLEVEVGETITFEVTNKTSMEHEFVLGNAAYQDGHDSQMGAMEHAEGNGVLLEPGASGSVTWTFTQTGEVLYACHIDGHYKAGMFGRITVR